VLTSAHSNHDIFRIGTCKLRGAAELSIPSLASMAIQGFLDNAGPGGIFSIASKFRTQANI